MNSSRRRLRVVHLCAVDFTVRQFIAPVALALQRAGFDVRCACTKGPHWQELANMKVRMVEMPIARSSNPIAAIRAVWRLYKWLGRDQPDILHVHTPVASMIGRLAGWLAGVPVIVYTAHGFYFHDRMPPRKRRVHIALERIFGRFQDYLFCVSPEDAGLAKERRFTRPGRIFTVPNGADPERFDPDRTGAEARAAIRGEFGIPADAPVVTIMGRLVREKGYAEFFHAAARLAPDFAGLHFLVVGDTVVSEHDDAKAEIVNLAQHDALKGRVHFTGLRRDIPELLAASDIFCLPSYREGMPVSIIEAMLMGVPTIATRIRGCRELIRDGEDGLLIEPQSVEELEDALRALLEHPEWACSFARSGRARALRRFDERKTLDRQVRLYKRIAEESFR